VKIAAQVVEAFAFLLNSTDNPRQKHFFYPPYSTKPRFSGQKSRPPTSPRWRIIAHNCADAKEKSHRRSKVAMLLFLGTAQELA
jgi:hypothetical protein